MNDNADETEGKYDAVVILKWTFRSYYVFKAKILKLDQLILSDYRSVQQINKDTPKRTDKWNNQKSFAKLQNYKEN